MNAPTTSTGTDRGSWSARAVLATILGLSVLGAVGLYREIRLDAQAVGVVWAFTAAVTWIVYGIIVLGAVVALQRYGHRPFTLLALAIAWGGFAATWMAGKAHQSIDAILTNTGRDASWTTWGTSPLIEESLKSLGILLLILLPALPRIGALDGAFIGAAVGVGFQFVEDFTFTIPALETQATDPGGALVTMVFLRGLLGLLSHVVFSALIGAAIGWYVGLRRPRGAAGLGWVVLAFAGAVSLHASMNRAADSSAIGAYFALSLLGAVALALVVLRARRSEDDRLATWVAGPGADLVDPSVGAALADGSGSRRARRRALASAARSERQVLVAASRP